MNLYTDYSGCLYLSAFDENGRLQKDVLLPSEVGVLRQMARYARTDGARRVGNGGDSIGYYVFGYSIMFNFKAIRIYRGEEQVYEDGIENFLRMTGERR